MKFINKISVITCFALFSIARAQHNDAGTTAFSFLNMGYDARSVAMAGAAVAMPNDVYGVLSNPAAVSYVNRLQVMGGYRQVMMDVWGGPLALSYQLPNGFVLVPHLLTLTTGIFDFINESGFADGRQAKSSYTAVGVSAGKIFFEGVSIGATLKGLYHYLGLGSESYSADGFALDLGVQYRMNNNRLIYGAALRNFGFVRSGYLGEWNEYEMPYGIEAGVSYVPRHILNLRTALDINKYNGDFMNIEPGFEYTVLANTLFLRGGYAFSSMDLENMLKVFSGDRDEAYQKSSMNTFSLGLGLVTAMDGVAVNFDAAIQFYSGVSSPGIVLSLLVGF
ncbi:MAG: PorV/PorQ family protein [Chitinispirillales bacterium]|nr:PorV/PorQ family protein [Chitinispirillales bacterium]